MDVASGLNAIWHQLEGVRSFAFSAKSQSQNGGWNGVGQGKVIVEQISSEVMLFHEIGTWQLETGKLLAFTNVYRWTALSDTGSIRLEHLRFGHNHPVYLFDLAQTDGVNWQSIEPHVCREDLYTATMRQESGALLLNWIVKGPSTYEDIRYSYQSLA